MLHLAASASLTHGASDCLGSEPCGTDACHGIAERNTTVHRQIVRKPRPRGSLSTPSAARKVKLHPSVAPYWRFGFQRGVTVASRSQWHRCVDRSAGAGRPAWCRGSVRSRRRAHRKRPPGVDSHGRLRRRVRNDRVEDSGRTRDRGSPSTRSDRFADRALVSAWPRGGRGPTRSCCSRIARCREMLLESAHRQRAAVARPDRW